MGGTGKKWEGGRKGKSVFLVIFFFLVVPLAAVTTVISGCKPGFPLRRHSSKGSGSSGCSHSFISTGTAGPWLLLYQERELPASCEVAAARAGTPASSAHSRVDLGSHHCSLGLFLAQGVVVASCSYKQEFLGYQSLGSLIAFLFLPGCFFVIFKINVQIQCV